jgi:hypothetical protein
MRRYSAIREGQLVVAVLKGAGLFSRRGAHMEQVEQMEQMFPKNPPKRAP